MREGGEMERGGEGVYGERPCACVERIVGTR